MAGADRIISDLLNCDDEATGTNCTPGRAPQLELHGELQTVEVDELKEPLTPEQTEAIADAILGDSAEQRARLDAEGACDCSHIVGNNIRLRVNIFRVNNRLSIVTRVVKQVVPELVDLGMPESINELAQLKNGLVLVTGSTGSGKSTTLASIVAEINRTRPVHVITLEDPVEFVHKHGRATVNQREYGTDFSCFREGLRAAMRQSPHVIMLGEMRDRESVEIAIKAAETGHLVFSTLHTLDAGRAISRITGMFDQADVPFIRMRLAETLKCIIGQRLLPRDDRPGRVVAAEVMLANMRTRELIRLGESQGRSFYQVLTEGRNFGMQTFDQHIIELYERGVVNEDTARGYATEAAVISQEIDRLRAKAGEDTSDLGELELERRVDHRHNPYARGDESWRSSASRTSRRT